MDSTVALIISISALLFSILSPIVTAIINGHYSIKEKNLTMLSNSAKENNDSSFRWMWLTIVLSFAFYIPVVLLADVIPMIGMLMIPKTCAYVWTVLIGYKAMKKEIA